MRPLTVAGVHDYAPQGPNANSLTVSRSVSGQDLGRESGLSGETPRATLN